MTDREKAIVMAYTDVCTLQGDKLSVFYDYVAEIMGSRMNTLQMAMLAKEIKRKAEPDFIKLCEDATDKNVGGKWISVKNRLPKDQRNVLTINGHGEINIMCLWSKRGELWTWIYHERFVHYNDITHWMPLPEPPKEAEDANR